MKFISTNFLLLLFPFFACCQLNDQKEIKGFSPFFIGDSIASFRASLICAGVTNLDKPYNDSLKCNIYRFVQAGNDGFELGNVRFTEVVLYSKDNSTIHSILYNRTFIGSHSDPKQKAINNDYDSLARFLSELLQNPGQEKKYARNKYANQKGIEWKSGEVNFLLERSFTTTNKKQKNLYTIVLSLSSR
jgi:hypothetical protein